MVNCARCGEEIPAGEEVKRNAGLTMSGFVTKKSYHKECAAKVTPVD